jgi:hypothetical protein
MTRRRLLYLVIGLLLLLLAWRGWGLLPSRAYAHVRALQEEWLREQTHGLPAEERWRLWEELYGKFGELTDAEREALYQERRRHYRRLYAEFPAWPKDRQTRYLDEEIDFLEASSREFLRGRAAKGGGAPPPGKELEYSPTREPPRGKDRPADRDDWRRAVLGSVSAEERLQTEAYFKMLVERRRERGLVGRPGRP